jgi:hypothetical protein
MNNFECNLYIPLIMSLDVRNTLITEKKFANTTPRKLRLTLQYFVTKCSQKGTGNPPPHKTPLIVHRNLWFYMKGGN